MRTQSVLKSSALALFAWSLLLIPVVEATDWIKLDSGTNKKINDIAFGNGTLVAVGEGGLVLISNDNGKSWIIQNTAIAENLSVIAFGNGAFVAVATSGLFTSTDQGKTWSKTSSAAFVDVAFGNGIFVAIANTASSGVMRTSTNGTTWSSQSPNPDDNGIHTWEILSDITFANGKFEVVGRGLVIITYMGITIPHPHSGFIMDSIDGKKWGRESYGDWEGSTEKYKFLKYVHDLTNTLNLFVAIGEGNKIFTSNDGFSWTARTLGIEFYGLAWGTNELVAAGGNGTIQTSTNGMNWMVQNSPTSSNLNNVLFANNSFYVVGNDGAILKSAEAPVANFAGSPTSGVEPLTVQFTDQSTGEITSRSWDFGDGQSSALQNPSHIYQNAGTYTVKLTVTGLYGSNTKTRTDYIAVLKPIVADFISAPTSGSAPLTVQFTDQSSGSITSWLWDFGDGQISRSQNSSHIYQNAGSYTVKLTVTGPAGSSIKTRPNYISVFPNAYITVAAPNGGEVWYVGTSQNITWTSSGTSGNVKIEYTTNGGSSWSTIIPSTTDNGSYAWAIPNTPSTNGFVKITDVDGSPSDQSNGAFTIRPVFITVTAPNGGEVWNVGTSQNITWTSSGTSGNVKIEYSTNGGSSWSTIIGSTPDDGSYAWTIPNSLSTNCLVKTTDIDGSPSDQSNSAFTIRPVFITVTAPNGGEVWNVGTSQNITWTSSGTSGNVKIEYSTNGGSSWSTIVGSTPDDGSYAWLIPNMPSTNCLVRITDIDGSPFDQSNSVFSINVIAPVVADFAGVPTSGLAPLTVQFTDQSSGNINSWQWNFGDGQTSTLQNPSYIYLNAGRYTVELTVSGAGGSHTKRRTDYINVSEKLMANFTATPRKGQKPLTVEFRNHSLGNFESYFWSFGDGEISTLQNPAHTFNAVSSYTVSLTVTGPEGSAHKTAPNYVLVQDKSYAPGAVKWSRDVGNRIQGCAAIGTDGTIYIGTWNGYLHAFQPDGGEIWKFERGGSIYDSPAIGIDGTIYQGAGIKFYAVNPNGTKKWESPLQRQWSSSPALGSDGTTYVGAFDEKLYALNTDGTMKWEFYIGGSQGVSSSPAIGDDGTIYIGGDNRIFYALTSNGAKKWSIPAAQVWSSPAIDSDGSIYFGDMGGKKVYALKPDGTIKWTFTAGGFIESSPAIGEDGAIYVGCGDSCLYAINPDGSLRWRFPTGGQIESSSPAIGGDGIIYIGSKDGYLYALTPLGSRSWRTQIGNEIDSSPALGPDGTIYIGSSDYPGGKFYAIASSSPGLADTPWPKFRQNSLNDGAVQKPKLIADFMATPTGGVKPLAVQFINQSIGIFTGQVWDFGDGQTSFEINPLHTYENNGAYTVSLEVRGTEGSNKKIRTNYITTGTTSVDDGLPVIASEFSLSQNYPNPFNPETTIRFSLPKSYEIELSIYNVLGGKVRTLAKSKYAAGWHQIHWDSRDDGGSQVGSGIYFVKLHTAGFAMTRKMSLIR